MPEGGPSSAKGKDVEKGKTSLSEGEGGDLD